MTLSSSVLKSLERLDGIAISESGQSGASRISAPLLASSDHPDRHRLRDRRAGSKHLGSGLNRGPPGDGRCEQDGGQKVVCSFVVSCGDATEVFEKAEHSFDSIAAAIGHRIASVGMLAGRVWRDDGFASALDEPVAQFSSVVGSICQKPAGCRHELEDCSGAHQVVGVARCQQHGPGPTEVVGQGVDLGGSTASGGADGVVEGSPFAPAAERCALT